MNIRVRILAEASEPLLNRELVHIEDTFKTHIVKEIVKELVKLSPYDRRMESLSRRKDSQSSQHRQIWSSARMLKDKHLRDSWAVSSGVLGSKSIYNRMPYAYYLAKGTGIYGPRGRPITPVEKKAMSFYYSFIRRWVVLRSVKGINPARTRFQSVIDMAHRKGTTIGVRKAMAELERTWRGTLQIR